MKRMERMERIKNDIFREKGSKNILFFKKDILYPLGHQCLRTLFVALPLILILGDILHLRFFIIKKNISWKEYRLSLESFFINLCKKLEVNLINDFIPPIKTLIKR